MKRKGAALFWITSFLVAIVATPLAADAVGACPDNELEMSCSSSKGEEPLCSRLLFEVLPKTSVGGAKGYTFRGAISLAPILGEKTICTTCLYEFKRLPPGSSAFGECTFTDIDLEDLSLLEGVSEWFLCTGNNHKTKVTFEVSHYSVGTYTLEVEGRKYVGQIMLE